MIEKLFCSQVTIENRNKVRQSLAAAFPKAGETVQGHIFEANGCYRSYWMKYSPDEIAGFICLNDKDKLICNSDDYAILNTQGKLIDLCIDDKQERLNCISALSKYKQMNVPVNMLEFEDEREEY